VPAQTIDTSRMNRVVLGRGNWPPAQLAPGRIMGQVRTLAW